MSYTDENSSARQSANASPVMPRKICVHDAIANLGKGLEARRRLEIKEMHAPHPPTHAPGAAPLCTPYPHPPTTANPGPAMFRAHPPPSTNVHLPMRAPHPPVTPNPGPVYEPHPPANANVHVPLHMRALHPPVTPIPGAMFEPHPPHAAHAALPMRAPHPPMMPKPGQMFEPHPPPAPNVALPMFRNKHPNQATAFDVQGQHMARRAKVAEVMMPVATPPPYARPVPSLPDLVGVTGVHMGIRGLPAGKPKAMGITAMCRAMGGNDTTSPFGQEGPRTPTPIMPPDVCLHKKGHHLPPMVNDEIHGCQGQDPDKHDVVPHPPKGPKTGKPRRRVVGRKPH